MLRSADAVILGGMNIKSAFKSDDEALKVSLAVEGRLNAVRHVREKGVPFLGIGVGLHVAVIESARSLGGIKGANSAEFDHDCTHPVVCATPEGEPDEDGNPTGPGKHIVSVPHHSFW